MERAHKVILGVLAVILILTVGAAVCVYLMQGQGGEQKGGTPTFTPPPFDEAAVSGIPSDVDETLNYSQLAVKEGFVVSLCGRPTVDADGRATVYFTSDAGNTAWFRLLVLTEDGKELGSTGLLRPGEYVKSVELTNAPAAGATLVFKILSYAPDTYYSMGTAQAQVVVGGE